MYNGNNCKIFQMSSIEASKLDNIIFKKTKFWKLANTISVYLLCISILVAIILAVIMSTFPQIPSKLRFIEDRTIGYSYLKKYLAILSVSLNTILLVLFSAYDGFNLALALIMYLRKMPNIEQKDLENDPLTKAKLAEDKITKMRMPVRDGKRKRTGATGRLGSTIGRRDSDSPTFKNRKLTLGIITG